MSTDLYTSTFGFRERPFSLSPDPDFLFWSKAHGRAHAVLEYGIVTRAPLTVVTGEVGTGKTTLIQNLLRQVGGEVTLGLISNAQGDRGDLLRWVLHALDLEAPSGKSYVEMFQLFQDFVIDQYGKGQHVVLIIDEAQNLGLDSLEELRMLTNINSGKDELLQIILTGQPELRELITRPEMRQFAQRVTATYHIHPFDKTETTAYIRHRLNMAGGTGHEITPLAMPIIYEHSGGIPRIINKLCDLALVYAAAGNRLRVTPKVLEEVLGDNLLLKSNPTPLVLYNRIDGGDKAAE
ncbi:MAG: AAA family ATPase [Pseudomonadota bacterium]